MDTTFYLLHWVFLIAALAFSWRRSQSLLHPHLMFTIMLCVQVVDFLIRGYDDPNLNYIDDDAVHEYQFIILLIFSLIVVASAFIRNSKVELLSKNAYGHLAVNEKARLFILVAVVVIVTADLLKRFSTVNWSLTEVILQSMLPRGQRDWEQGQFSGNYLFAITTILLPLAGLAASFLTTTAKLGIRLVAFASLAFVIAILISNGSRTPVVMVLATTGLIWYVRMKSSILRFVLIPVTGIAIALSSSFMYLTRSYGLSSDAQGAGRFLDLAYHMDDSYYRAIYAYHHADAGIEFWDPVTFVGTILANPIPRALWPEKPILTQEFYGGYKLDYVTNLFVGETVAMAGVTPSILVAPLLGLLLYWALFRAQRVLNRPLGLVAYLLVGLYVYMCVRSLVNVMHFIYLPAAAVVLVLILSRHQRPPRAEVHHVNQRLR